jgi:hypothetical protein
VGVATGWALAAAAPAEAGSIGSSHPFGLGVGIGLPTAITGKYYLGGDVNALEFQLGAWGDFNHGYYGHGYGSIYVHVVYLWHPSVVAEGSGFEIPWHVGVGGALWSGGGYCGWGNNHYCGDDLALAARVPIGLDFNFDDPRFQIFGDLALNVLVFPGINLDLGLQIGARYYF